MERFDLFTGRQLGYHLYRIPALVVTPSGTVLAFCEGRRYTSRDDDEIDILLRRSFDGGKTWEARQMVISDGDRTCGNPCPVVDGRTGTVILPFCKDNQQVFVCGAKMTLYASDEFEAVEMSDGTVYANMRSRQGHLCRSTAWSRDGGETWSQVEYDSALPGSSCQGSTFASTLTASCSPTQATSTSAPA